MIGDPQRYPFTQNRSYTPPLASESDYFTMLARLGLERMVIVQPSVYGYDNSCTLDAVAAAGQQRARAVLMIPPTATPAMLRSFDEAGGRAARFITIAKGGGTLDQLQDVARLVAPLGWHLEIYIPAEGWRELASVILSLPVPVVIDHMGQITSDKGPDDPNFQAILRLLDSGRCWIKLCGYRNSAAGHPYSDVLPLARRYVAHAPERCVWGTDWPHTNVKGAVPDDLALLGLLHEWVPDEAARRRILVSNPAKLYRFD